MSFNQDTAKAYKLIFAKTGKAKEVRNHAKKTLKKFEKGIHIPEVMVKISSFSKSVQSLSNHQDYVSRNGKEKVYDCMDNEIGDETESQTKALHRQSKEIGERDSKGLNSKTNKRQKRLACNLVLSMPPNTPKDGFRDSVREFLSENFSNHDYTYAFHDDTDSYHSHVSIPVLGFDEKRLDPKRDDLAQWRESFANALEKNGILANAMPAPSRNRKTTQHDSHLYPDTKVIEHGLAPYNFKEKNTDSYYIKLENEKGEERILWGKDLERVLLEREIKTGDMAYFSYEGSEEVELKIDQKNKSGEIIGQKTITVERHTWDGGKIPEKDISKKDRSLSEKAKEHALNAWKIIQRDMEGNKDIETSSLISRFCQTRFGQYLPTKGTKQDLDDKVR